MQITAIAAVADNGVIGDGAGIPWRIPGEQARFKELTTANFVVMGRGTYESIGHPLPNRTTIIVTRNGDFAAPESIGATRVLVAGSVEDALQLAATDRFADPDRSIYVAGGGQIYAQMMPLFTGLEITEVHQSPDGDVVFPAIDPEQWVEVRREPHDGFDYVRWAPITRTERLVLTPATSRDFDEWFALHSNPEAFPNSTDAVLTDPDVCRMRLSAHEQGWVTDGLGYWVARSAIDLPGGPAGSFVGAGGVKRQTLPNGDQFWSLYFRLQPEFTGVGLATELSETAVRQLARIDDHARVRITIRADNAQGIRIAQKHGMKLLAERDDEFGQPLVVYQSTVGEMAEREAAAGSGR